MLGTNDVKTLFPLDAPGIAAGAGRLSEVVLRSAAGPRGAAPRVLLVAPPPVAPPPAPLQEVWGFSAGAAARARALSGYYRAVAASLGIAFLDGGEHAQVSPADGVHLDGAAQARLGAAIAEAVARMLAGA
jgi:lysophospholipase L1-like esterase